MFQYARNLWEFHIYAFFAFMIFISGQVIKWYELTDE